MVDLADFAEGIVRLTYVAVRFVADVFAAFWIELRALFTRRPKPERRITWAQDGDEVVAPKDQG